MPGSNQHNKSFFPSRKIIKNIAGEGVIATLIKNKQKSFFQLPDAFKGMVGNGVISKLIKSKQKSFLPTQEVNKDVIGTDVAASTVQDDNQNQPFLVNDLLDENVPNDPSVFKTLAVEGSKLLFIGAGVSLTFLLPDILLHIKHTDSDNKSFNLTSSRGGFGGIVGVVKILATTYVLSFKGAMIKNSVLFLGQKGNIHGKVLSEEEAAKLSILSEGEAAAKSTVLSEEEADKLLKFVNNIRSATVIFGIGIFETTLTQYLSNKRTWNNQKFNDINFIEPIIKNLNGRVGLKEVVKVGSLGYPIRASKNILTVAGFFINPIIKQYLQPEVEKIVPDFAKVCAVLLATSANMGDENIANVVDLDKADIINQAKLIEPALKENLPELATVLATGFSIGTITNMMEIIYKSQLIKVKVDQGTLKVPSIKETINDLLATEGPKAFKRGLWLSVLYTALAYYIVPKWQQLAEEWCSAKIERYYDNTMTFFSRQRTSNINMQEQKEIENSTNTQHKDNENNENEASINNQGPRNKK
jgi:hypothetical protein